ncbi:uncharacterized protein [Watersipora subatra]|uniref:uncharacterized protein isoform X2 n=1 Tax=Watersipora subatra TaxID=2589382 RepID=UPI00355C6D22
MSSSKCSCCTEKDATRMCFSCDPSGKDVVYMCGACNDRAHFGPMKLSHHVKSLVNLAAREQIVAAHKDWSATRQKAVMECIKELKACVSDLEYQKRVDLDIMSAAFDPLKNAVVNRKRELSAQIISHYDSLKPTLAGVIHACEDRLKVIDTMTDFQPSSIKDLLPEFSEGHRTIFPPEFDLASTIEQIKECKLTSSLSDSSSDLHKNLTLLPGDVVDVTSSLMDSDGVFWLKRNTSPEYFAPLSRLSFDCRQKLILGEKKRYSECPQDLHTGLIVMANLPDDGVWRRAVVADPCVKDKADSIGHMASVILVDTGYQRNLYHNRLAVCCQAAQALPFFASQCSLYPGEHEPVGTEPKWLYNDLVMEQNEKRKVLKARFVHKKEPAYSTVPVWYVELVDKKNPEVTINQLIEKKRCASSIGKGAILHKDIRVATGEVAPSPIQICTNKASPAASVDVTITSTVTTYSVTPASLVTAITTSAVTTITTSAVATITTSAVPTITSTFPADEDDSKCESADTLGEAVSAHSTESHPHDTLHSESLLPPTSVSEVSVIINEGEPTHNSTVISSPELIEVQPGAGEGVLLDTPTTELSGPKAMSTIPDSQISHAQVLNSQDFVDAANSLTTEDKVVQHTASSTSPIVKEAFENEHEIERRSDSGFNSVSKINSSEVGEESYISYSSQIPAMSQVLSKEELINQQQEVKEVDVVVDSATSGASTVCNNNADSCVSSPSENYEAWQEPANSSALSTRSDEYVQKKNKKRKQKNSKKNGCSSSDTLSDPGIGRHVSQASRGDEQGFRLAKVVGQSAIRNWIRSPGRSAYGLPTLTDVERAAKTSHPPSTNTEVDQNTCASNGTVQESSIPSQTLHGTGDGTQVNASGWEKTAPHSQLAPPTGSSQPIEDQNRRNRSSGGCFVCKETGHFARNCPLKDRYYGQPCLLCSQPHVTEECESAKKMYDSGGCPYCLTTTHKMSACNTKKQYINFRWLGGSHKSGRRGGY